MFALRPLSLAVQLDVQDTWVSDSFVMRRDDKVDLHAADELFIAHCRLLARFTSFLVHSSPVIISLYLLYGLQVGANLVITRC